MIGPGVLASVLKSKIIFLLFLDCFLFGAPQLIIVLHLSWSIASYTL